MSLDTSVIRECTAGSFAGTVAFPEVVRRLSVIGVEKYHADLVRLEKRTYAESGEVDVEPLPLDAPPSIAAELAQDGVRQALAAVQQRQISYPEFLRRIMAAGVDSYVVFLKGRKTIYLGRRGDFYVEPFPGSP